MQFIVLIEFLVTGLGTALLAYALLGHAIPLPPPGLPSGETPNALLILAVSYPLGILVNFPIFLVQRRLLTPKIHRRILDRYLDLGIDLEKLASRQIGLIRDAAAIDHREIFNVFRAAVYSKNIDRLNYGVAFYEGLERFSRGMLPPLILAIVYVLTKSSPCWLLMVFLLCGLLASSLALLVHSVKSEEEQIARFFSMQIAQVERTEISGRTDSSTTDPGMSKLITSPALGTQAE